VLGPIEVLLDDRPLPFGAGTERALVALLALNANRPVSTDSIVDALWGDLPPSSAREMVRTYVARVRKRVGPAVQRQPGGYLLQVAPEAVDALRFEELCREGVRQFSDDHPAAATDTLSRALLLWRGAPLPELETFAVAREEIARLEELRLTAIETRAAAELELGNAAVVVSELTGQVRSHPYRERLRRELILALYRCGRQTDALDCYLEGRRLLVEEIGIEPSRELQALQQAVLNQDPALDHAPWAPRVRSSESEAAPPRPAGRRGLKTGVISAVFALFAVVLVVYAILGQAPAAGLGVGRDTLVQVDPSTGKIVHVRTVAGAPGPIAVGVRTAWLGDGQERSVLTLDPATLRTRDIARLGVFPYQLASDGSTAWAGDGFYGTITAIDSHGQVSRPFRPEPRATGGLAVTFGAGALWVGSEDGSLVEVNPATDIETSEIRGAGDAAALAVGAGSVWIAEATEDDLRRVSLASHSLTTSIPIGGTATGIAVGEGSIWAITPAESRVWRVDPRTGAVTAGIEVAPHSSLITAVDGEIWVGSSTGMLQRLDPTRNVVTKAIHLPGPIGGLAGGDRRLWVSVG
jgi:DNA-binding SARP family transcriptional activator/streptogramin lyase